jgi:hypothetical protein
MLSAHFPYFFFFGGGEGMKIGLYDLHAVCVSLLINFWMVEPIFMYIMAPEPIWTAYFINPSQKSVRLYVYPHTVARQRFAKETLPRQRIHTLALMITVIRALEAGSERRLLSGLARGGCQRS